MIRGIQKNMIWVQTPKSPYFEEIHFIVRRQIDGEEARNGEMAKEANRILAEYNAPQKNPPKLQDRKQSRGGAIAFLWGMLVGSLLVGVAWLMSLIVG